jgi:hypothetical protein
MSNLRSQNLAPAVPDKSLRQFLQYMRTDLGTLSNDLTRMALRKTTVTSGQDVRLSVSGETIEGVIPVLNSTTIDESTYKQDQSGSVTANLVFLGTSQEVTFLLILRG